MIFENCSFNDIYTLSQFIVSITFTNDVVFRNINVSNFSPNFFHASFSKFTLLDSVFDKSFKEYGVFHVSALNLEQNCSFLVENTTFSTLKNELNGPV